MMKLTVKELRGLAKENGLKGYSALKKAELVELLVAHNVVLDSTVEDVHNEGLINDDYTNEVAISKDMSDKELADYLGLDDSDEEEGFYDEKLGLHVTPDMIGEEEVEDELISLSDDEDSTNAPDNCNENNTVEETILAWEKQEAEYRDVYGDKASEVFASEQEARYSEDDEDEFDAWLNGKEKVNPINEIAVAQDTPVSPRTYAEIMVDKFEEVLDVPANRLELKAEKDKSYNNVSNKITVDNIGNTHMVSGGQAKYLQDLFLNYKITVKDDIKTAEEASDKLNAINKALTEGKLEKRKSTVFTKNRPTKAQLQLIISKQGYINIMSCPKTKVEASKLISNLNKKEFLAKQSNKQQVQREVAVTSDTVSNINKKVDTLTSCKNSNKGKFKRAISKFFNSLFK